MGAVEAALQTNQRTGLSSAEAAARLRQEGPNELARGKAEPWWEEIFESLTEPLVLLLLAVAVVYGLVGALGDVLTILAVILLVTAAEVANEGRAKRAIRSLRALAAPTAPVVRDGEIRQIPTRELVQGDLVLLEPGERVPADARLAEAAGLRVGEASLTGESASVSKQAEAVLPVETVPADRRNLAFAGTLVVSGHGRGIVVATGRATELGRVAGLAEKVREPRTPLQLQLRQLAGRLLWFAVGFSAVIPLFATIPEELPILVTAVLGLGAYRLARHHAIVKRLRAAETLGSVTVVGTDKTGTLTENRLTVVAVVTADGEQNLPFRADTGASRRLFEIAVIANDAQLVRTGDTSTTLGDPTEAALLVAAEQAGVSVEQLRNGIHILATFPFERARQRLAVAYSREATRRLALKMLVANWIARVVGRCYSINGLKVVKRGRRKDALRVRAIS